MSEISDAFAGTDDAGLESWKGVMSSWKSSRDESIRCVHFAHSFGLTSPFRAERGELLLAACDGRQKAGNISQSTDEGEGEPFCGASVGKFTNPLPGSMCLPQWACTEPCPTLMPVFPPRGS